jgi:hypothetical protein
MIVIVFLTAIYQVLLNLSFGPLFTHLPITFEDEAVLRDEAFERAQSRRLGLDPEDDLAAPLTNETLQSGNESIEMSDLHSPLAKTTSKGGKFNPANMAHEAGSWAARSGRTIRSKALGRGTRGDRYSTSASPHPHAVRKRKPRDDIEDAQNTLKNALFGGADDEIEDLTPDERDTLVQQAFQHAALRVREPAIWIPRDDIGVSDDEVKRTREFSQHIWISNGGAALDAKGRVVYARNPPDFSHVDFINL